MTLTRDAIAYYLDSQFSSLAAAIGQDDDPTLGYQPDIDLALRKLGKSRSEVATATLEDSQEEAAFALAKYYALERISSQLGDRVNRSTGKVSFNFSHQLTHVEKLLERARALCASLGYDVTGEGWGVGYINLDWIENEVRT